MEVQEHQRRIQNKQTEMNKENNNLIGKVMPVASSVTREFTPTQILRQNVNKTRVLIGQAH